MSDILRQVDEDLRKDRLLKIWKSYGIYIVGSILGLLLILSGYQYYLFSSKSKNEKFVEQYINALNEKDKVNAINLLDDLDGSDNSYIKGLAKLKKVDLYASLDEHESALNILQEVFNDGSLDSIIRDLALYKYLMIQINVIDDEEFIQIIDDSNVDEGNFRYLFNELKALKALIIQDKEKGLELFQNILNDPDAPQDIKDRSKKFLTILKNE